MWSKLAACIGWIHQFGKAKIENEQARSATHQLREMRCDLINTLMNQGVNRRKTLPNCFNRFRKTVETVEDL